MPDIAMCQNEECPSRMKCYRYTAVPDEFRQGYCAFFVKKLRKKCDDFWDNKGRSNRFESEKSK